MGHPLPAPEDGSSYRAHLDWMERIALSPETSRDFIRDIKAGKADHLL
ncbi:hypothetical protein [Streptomyces yerevanensis]|nr:hypothetical protein [Streptomyces yerevanensis]